MACISALSSVKSNTDDATLEKVAQGGLCRALVILGADGNQCFVAEEVVASLGERSPRHDVRAVLLHNLLRFYLLVEYVRLHLIDHRGNLAELRQWHVVCLLCRLPPWPAMCHSNH